MTCETHTSHILRCRMKMNAIYLVKNGEIKSHFMYEIFETSTKYPTPYIVNCTVMYECKCKPNIVAKDTKAKCNEMTINSHLTGKFM